jgi:hypothetical protein
MTHGEGIISTDDEDEKDYEEKKEQEGKEREKKRRMKIMFGIAMERFERK